MKKLLTIAALLLVTCGAFAQKHRSYVIGFYNLENLFDTYHDEGKNDYQYLPDGQNEWTEAKYQQKLKNMARVIRAMRDDNGRYHTILGVSEVENRHVLDDLVNEPAIAEANYQIVHYDGPDRRGVDVALFYKPEQFKLLESLSIPFTFEPSQIDFSAWTVEEKDAFRTRDVLFVRGTIDGEMFGFYVAHLPSRLGGKGADLRPRGAEIIYDHAMKMEQEYPGIKIVVMGDMNDNPTDVSMTKFMHGREKISEVGPEDFYSPFLSMFKKGFSSLYYRGEGNIYDIILTSRSLVAGEGLQLQKINRKGYYGRVFKKDFMTNQSGPYKGTPFRTFSGGAYIGGYSDHYPTYIVVSK